MQDKAIAQIGHWQLEINKDLDPVDLYIENMFPGKDYQMLMLVFEIEDEIGLFTSSFERLDLQVVGGDSSSYIKYAYRSGSPNGGDITLSTILSITTRKDIFINLRKKISKMKVRFSEIENYKFGKEVNEELKASIGFDKKIFSSISEECTRNYYSIVRNTIKQILNCDTNVKSIGISFQINIHDKVLLLNDFSIVKELILKSGAETKYKTQDSKSISKNKHCSVSGKIEDTIYGFAAPFSFSTVDKKGSISGFFNKDKNWRNYPISSSEAFALEQGKRFILTNLKGTFYNFPFLVIPHIFIDNNYENLSKVILYLKTAFGTKDGISDTREKKNRAEDRGMSMMGAMSDNLSIDLVFFETQNAAFRIKLNIEEILPSRFNTLFNIIPKEIQTKSIFKDALNVDGVSTDLIFSFDIIKQFFSPYQKSKQRQFNSPVFLEATYKIFRGIPIKREFLFEKIMYCYRMWFNENLHAEKYYGNALELPIKKALMLIDYLQTLNIIQNNKNYKYMEIESVEKKSGRFNLSGFNEFVKENIGFLDTEIKVGLFSVGVLVRFLYDIQAYELQTQKPPFENKLRGYKLNSELLMLVYTEALDKIQKYQKNFYVYSDLREIVNQYFVVRQKDMNSMSNNELSFYFVAGLEMGRKFKNEKEDNNQEEKPLI